MCENDDDGPSFEGLLHPYGLKQTRCSLSKVWKGDCFQATKYHGQTTVTDYTNRPFNTKCNLNPKNIEIYVSHKRLQA